MLRPPVALPKLEINSSYRSTLDNGRLFTMIELKYNKHIKYKKLRYHEEHSASVVLSW